MASVISKEQGDHQPRGSDVCWLEMECPVDIKVSNGMVS